MVEVFLKLTDGSAVLKVMNSITVPKVDWQNDLIYPGSFCRLSKHYLDTASGDGFATRGIGEYRLIGRKTGSPLQQ